jgi:Mu transposase, C-terminal domain
VPTRAETWTLLIRFESGQYSVPHELAGQPVWVWRDGEQVVMSVITHARPAGPVEMAGIR